MPGGSALVVMAMGSRRQPTLALPHPTTKSRTTSALPMHLTIMAIDRCDCLQCYQELPASVWGCPLRRAPEVPAPCSRRSTLQRPWHPVAMESQLMRVTADLRGSPLHGGSCRTGHHPAPPDRNSLLQSRVRSLRGWTCRPDIRVLPADPGSAGGSTAVPLTLDMLPGVVQTFRRRVSRCLGASCDLAVQKLRRIT